MKLCVSIDDILGYEYWDREYISLNIDNLTINEIIVLCAMKYNDDHFKLDCVVKRVSRLKRKDYNETIMILLDKELVGQSRCSDGVIMYLTEDGKKLFSDNGAFYDYLLKDCDFL